MLDGCVRRVDEYSPDGHCRELVREHIQVSQRVSPAGAVVEVEQRDVHTEHATAQTPTERLELDAPIESYVGPTMAGGMPGAETTSMDSRKWFGAMVNRGLEATPDQDAALAYLQQISEAYAARPLGRHDDGHKWRQPERRKAGVPTRDT